VRKEEKETSQKTKKRQAMKQKKQARAKKETNLANDRAVATILLSEETV
jgi:hypothetical protein